MNHPELDEVDMFKIPWNQMRNILSISRAVKKHPEDSMFQDSSESDEKHSKYNQRTGDSDKSETYREQ